jgi:hypothetical protein
MIVTITKSELKTIVGNLLGRKVDVIVIDDPSELAGNVKAHLELTRSNDGTKIFVDGKINPFFKIAAIKALREFIPGMGLAEAKQAIENWDVWIGLVTKHNKYPSHGNNGFYVS